MTSTARRYSVSNPPPTGGLLQGRETQQEAEVLEVLAAQASRDGDESKAIQLMERALQIRCQVVTSLAEKASHCQDAAAAASSTATSPTNSLFGQRQRQEVAAAASEIHDQHQAATNDLYDAAERLVTRCNTYAVQSFKKNDYETAEGLLAYCLQLTEEDAYPLNEVIDRRLHLRSVTFNNYGSLERNRGHFREALHYLQASMEVTGTESPVAYMNMSAVLVQLRQCDEAAVAAARAVALLSHTPEDPALLAVAHHNYAMALEPVDPQRSLEEYATAYQTACSTVGPHSAASQSILLNWQRFRRHHPHLASAVPGAPAHTAGSVVSGTTTPSKKLFAPAPRSPTPPLQTGSTAHHLPAGRRVSQPVSTAASPAAAAASTLGTGNSAAAGTPRTVADPTAADLAEIFPHPFMASASMPKPAPVASPTPMYRPTLSGPRKPLVPATQPRTHTPASSSARPTPPPMRHQRPTPAPNFAATMQPVRQSAGKARAPSSSSVRPARPSTATGPRAGAGTAPPGHYVVGGGSGGRGTEAGRLRPVRPLTSGKTGVVAAGKSGGRTSPREGTGGRQSSGLLRAQRPPEKRPSALGRHALPPLSTASADADDDGTTSTGSGGRRSTQRTGRRGRSSSATAPRGSPSTSAGGGDLQSFMNDRLDMLLHDEEEFERKYAKAAVIQRAYRGHRARALAQARRASQARDVRLLAIRRAIAARRIQRAYRQAQYGLYAATVRRLMGQTARRDRGQCSPETLAATEMQRMARGWLARRAVRRERTYRARADPAALRLQTWYRGRLARRELQRLRDAQMERLGGFYGERYDDAATRIQSQWRAHLEYQRARVVLEARRLERLRAQQRQHTDAALCVQRGWRCARARREAAERRARRDHRAAQGRLYEAQRQAAIRLQSFGRMIIVQQRAHPGLNEARLRAAHKVRYARQNWAARTIQCAYRRHAAQRELQRRRGLSDHRRQDTFQSIVVRRLQRVGRGYLERLAISDMGEALAAEALRYIRGVANLHAQDAQAAALAEAAQQRHHEQRQAVLSFVEGEDILRMELELCENRHRRQILERESSARPAGLVVTTHVRVFPEDDWAAALQRCPDLLKEAFIIDLVDACELASAEQVRDVRLSLGSLCVDYAVQHNSDVSAAWLDAKAAYADFPHLYAIRATVGEEDAAERALELAVLEAEAMQAVALLEAEQEAQMLALATAAEMTAQAQQEPQVQPAQQAHAQEPEEEVDVDAEASEAAAEEKEEGEEEDARDSPETAYPTEAAEAAEAAQLARAPTPSSDEDVPLDVPMTLEEALAAERVKRAAVAAEARRQEALCEAREAAKQAFRQERIAAASTEADLAPYLPGSHVSSSHAALGKASFQRSMRPEKAEEVSRAAKELNAHRAASAQEANDATDATDRRRHRAATTIASAYRGHQARQYRRTLASLHSELGDHRADAERQHASPYVQYAQLRQHLGAGVRLPTEVRPPSKTHRKAGPTSTSPAPARPALPSSAATTTPAKAATPVPSTPPPAEDEVTREPLANLLPASCEDPAETAAGRLPQEVLAGFVKVVEAKRERQLRLETVQQLMAAAATPLPTPTARTARPVAPLVALAAENRLGDSNRALQGAASSMTSSTSPRTRVVARPVPVSMQSSPKCIVSPVVAVKAETDIGAEVSRTSGISTRQASAHFALASMMNASPKYPVEPQLAVGPEGALGAEKSQTSHAATSQASAHFALASVMNASPKYPVELQLAVGPEGALGAEKSQTSHAATSQASAHFALASVMNASPKYPVEPQLAVGPEGALGAERSQSSHAATSQASAHFALASMMNASPKYPVEPQLAVGPEGALGAEKSQTSHAATSQASVQLGLAPAMLCSPQHPAAPELAVGPEGALGAERSQSSHAATSQASAHFALASVMNASPQHPVAPELAVGREGTLGARASTRPSYSAVEPSLHALGWAESASASHLPSASTSQAALAMSSVAAAESASGVPVAPSAATREEARRDQAARTMQAFARRMAARRELAALRGASQHRTEEALAVEALLDDAATSIQRVYRGHRGRQAASQTRAAHEVYLAERMAHALAEDDEEFDEDMEDLSAQFPSEASASSSEAAVPTGAMDGSSASPFHPRDTLPYADAASPLAEATERPSSGLSPLSAHDRAAGPPQYASAPSPPLEDEAVPVMVPRHMVTYPSEDAVVREVQPGEPELVNSKSWEEI